MKYEKCSKLCLSSVADFAAASSSLTAPTVSGVWTVSMATLCWGQESVVGPVLVLATLALTTPMENPAMLTIPPTRSSATASRATQVSVQMNEIRVVVCQMSKVSQLI